MGAMGVSKYSLKYSHRVDGTLDDLETYLPMLPSIKCHGKIVFDASKIFGILCLGCLIFVSLHTLCGLIVV